MYTVHPIYNVAGVFDIKVTHLTHAFRLVSRIIMIMILFSSVYSLKKRKIRHIKSTFIMGV